VPLYRSFTRSSLRLEVCSAPNFPPGIPTAAFDDRSYGTCGSVVRIRHRPQLALLWDTAEIERFIGDLDCKQRTRGAVNDKIGIELPEWAASFSVRVADDSEILCVTQF
jgi:hypothetical protein